MPRCGAVILAAGASSRMGTAKQLLAIENTNFLLRTIKVVRAAQCDPIVVVLGANREPIERKLSGTSVHIAVNENWSAGIGSSIRKGVIELWQLQEVDALLLMVCDQPLISAEMIETLKHVYYASGKLIAAAEYSGALGTPAIFGRRLFDELLQLPDTKGGKAVITKYIDETVGLALPEAEFDIDTPDQYQNIISLPPYPNTAGIGSAPSAENSADTDDI